MSANVIFEDNFEDGNSDGWVSTLGPNLWEVKDINGSKMYGARIVNGSTLIDSVAATINTPNYQIDFDYIPISGDDRNIDFRWIADPVGNGYTPYEVHYLGQNFSFNNFGAPTINSSPLINNQINHIKIILQNKNVQVFINDIKIIDHIVSTYEYTSEKIGFRLSAGASFPTEGWFDNVKITTEGDDTLGVPLIKQTDSLWANNIYDNAFAWTPGSKSIGTWGCALTSAVMVFRHNGITKTPTGEDLTPGTVNSWLQGSVDGYVRNGLLNWLALTRLSRLAKITNILSFDALEYKRINHRDDNLLASSLGKNIPPILEEPGHFIVATGTDSANTTFFINDPYYDRTSLAGSYNKNYLTMGTYTPVNSDLSYIMLVVDPNINLNVIDKNGSSVGESFVQQPIADPLGINTNTKGPIKIYYYPKPTSGKHSVVLSTSGKSPYQLDEYLYDENGNVFKKTESGNLNGTKDTFIINFDKSDSTNTKTEKITFDYIKKEIIAAYKLKKIKNVGIYTALLGGLEIAKNSHNKSFTKAALDSMILIISKDRKNIDSAFASILISDIQSLKNSL